jgi:maltooligosyltrehalose trehalohydrolase
MDRQGRGWWTALSIEATHGTDYLFIIDDEVKGYPDPRSLWQPHGVHGPSRVYDHSRFAWTDATWTPPDLATGVVYELHIGTFTREGSFDAAIDRIDHLVSLGISHVEIMPVASFPGSRGWGYDGVAIYSAYEGYGGPDGLKRFVDACHAKGLAVVLDVVYNHFGPSGNYTGKFGPYLTDCHVTPWGGAVNLEGAGSDEVRRFYCDNAVSWLRDFHIDGLRLDAIHSLVDRSAIHFLEQLSKEVSLLSRQLGRQLVLIAESDLNDPRLVTDISFNGLGMDAQWSDDFHHALFAILRGKEQGYYEDFGHIADLCKAIISTFVYDGIYSTYRGHTHGRPVRAILQTRFLGYIQNHDQVGNRALGERLYPLVSERRARIAAAIVLIAPFVPMIFQGEEFGSSSPFQYFTDHEDPEMAAAVSRGRRREFAAFGWPPEAIPDPESIETFNNSKLSWEEVQDPPHSDFLAWYRDLILLRRSEPSLHDAGLYDLTCEFDEDDAWLIIVRGPVSVFCNLSSRQRSFHLSLTPTILLSSSDDTTCSDGTLHLVHDSIIILKSTSTDRMFWSVA